MIFLTTLSLKRIEDQQRAVNSWIEAKNNVISFNTKSEQNHLKKFFDKVEFIEPKETGVIEFNKDYVRLNCFTDWIKSNENSVLINSDIELYGELPIKKNKNSIVYYQRNDYLNTIERSVKFRSGIDAFYLTKEFCEWIPKTRLVLGQCHWDYFIPLIAIKRDFKLFSPIHSNLYHKRHQLNYDTSKWKYTAKIFATELGLTGDAYLDSHGSHKLIIDNTTLF